MAAKTKEIKEAGLKITLPRVKILQILESSKIHHLSAEDVYKTLISKDEDVGLATVYRVLTSSKLLVWLPGTISKEVTRCTKCPQMTIMIILFA